MAIVSPNVKSTLSGNPPRIPVRRGGTPRSARRGRQSVHVPPYLPRPRAAPLGVSGHDTTPLTTGARVCDRSNDAEKGDSPHGGEGRAMSWSRNAVPL